MKARPHQLVIAPSIAAAWTSAIAPWFQRVAAVSWKTNLPALVVVPTRGQANFLKQRLLDQGGSFLGLQFVTPSGLRRLLALEDHGPVSAPEHLRLLLAVAATECETESNESDALAAKAVARAPALLLRALERLKMAGWKFEQMQMPSFAPVVRRFEQLLAACEFVFPGEVDRVRARPAPSLFSDLLVAGFNGAHWPEWFALRHAVDLAQNATILLEEPRADLSEADLCWIGSWEEALGEARRLTQTAAPAGDSLFSEEEMRGEIGPTARFDFLIGANAAEQARAIALQCVRHLADEKCTRLGVIFSGAGALSRLVASALANFEIPHNDAIGHIVPGIFETAEWQAWLALQRAPRLNSFLRLVNAMPERAVLSPNLSPQDFEKILRESYSEILLDDLEVLREICGSRVDEKYRAVAEVLRAFVFLPPRATLAQFLAQTHVAFDSLGWKQQATEIAARSRDWPARLTVEISRALYLRWLEETAATFGAARAPTGDHPYARVQLLTVGHAQGQEWSHLIFAGWNEGTWPPPVGAEFAREEEIRAFNQSVQQLNRRAARQGNQGEGHTSVRQNHALYLGPFEQRAIALRQFDALLESAGEAVTFAASLLQEDAPERFWNPSECFTHLYLRTQRQPLTQATLKSLQQATAKWLDHVPAFVRKTTPASAAVRQTLVAFEARRDASRPAAEYDFALRPNESYRPVPILSVSDLEHMVSTPALVWMKRYLGVEPPDDTSNPWAATSGKWVHRWLASIAGSTSETFFVPFPAASTVDERVRQSADERRLALEQICDSLGKSVPDWWRSGWLNARYLARHLGGKIAGASGWEQMAAEVPIGRENSIRIADDVVLQLRGRIDLILAQRDATDLSGEKVWIVDYKTGSTKELKSSDLHDLLVKGTALQLGLYALALRELGAAEVSASILSLAVRKVAPQLTAADLAPHANVFADLAEMQQTGLFGMKGEVRPGFGRGAVYPLATLQIDQDILEDKWQRTHPNLVLEKEEWEVW